MNIRNNRVKVVSEGTDINVDFILGAAVDSFSTFTNGDVLYTALADTGEWQVARGTVAGVNLTRGTVEENYLGTTDQIDFTGKTLQIAQTLSAEFMNDITVISHDHDNKLILDGTEESYTTEDADKLAAIEEGAAADQIAIEVPYLPTGIEGDTLATDVQTAIESLDTDLTVAETAIVEHVHPASVITYNPIEDDTSDANNVQDALVNHGDKLNQRISSNSGVITGLDMVKVSALTFQVNIGTAEIYDSYTNPDIANTIELNLEIAVIATINYGTISTNTINVYLTSSLEIFQATGAINPQHVREMVLLGKVYTINGEISDIANAPLIIKQTATDLVDLYAKNARVSGGNILAASNVLNFYADSATLFSQGINYRANKTNPNEMFIAAVGDEGNPVSFYTVTQTVVNANGTISPSETYTIPKGYNPDGTTIVNLTGTEAVIHRVYGLGINGTDRKFFVVYGQTVYADAETAEESIQNDIDNFIPIDMLDNLQLYAYLCVSADSVDFNTPTNAWIVSALNQFDTGASSGPPTVSWGAIAGTLNDQLDLKAEFAKKEDALGNPSEDGFVLKSDSVGGRYWSEDVGITDHEDLLNIGTNTHDVIDLHIADTDNPHSLVAVQVPYDSTNDPTSDEINVQTAMIDHAESIEQRVPSGSGIILGGRLTASTQAGNELTHFDISDGRGEVFNSYTNPTNTSIIPVEWFGLTDIALEVGGFDAAVTKIYLTSAGTVLQTVGPINLGDSRDNILLGAIFSINGEITDLLDAPAVVKQTATDTFDSLAFAIHTTGSDVRPVTSELQVWAEDGAVFFPGVNYYNDRRSPNIATLSQEGDSNTPLEFYTVTQDGNVSATPITDIPKAVNASGGITSGLNGNDATIHRLYNLGVNPRSFLLLYGQFVYNNASVAKDNLQVDTGQFVLPSNLSNSDFLANICVANNADDFSDNTQAWIASGTGVTTSGTADTVDHTALANRDVVDQHPIAAIGTSGGIQLQDELDKKVESIPEWTSGTYQKDTLAKDNNGLYISLVEATDKPAPVEDGDPYNVYNGPDTVVSILAKSVQFETIYDWGSTAGRIDAYRIYTHIGNKYEVYVVSDLDGTPITNPKENFIAETEGWQIRNISPKIVNNVRFKIVVVASEPADTPTVYTANYDINNTNNVTAPTANGDWTHANKQLDTINIFKFDADGNDNSLELEAFLPGDIINTGSVRYTIQSSINSGTYMSFVVAPATQSLAGLTSIDFETVTPTPISYLRENVYWSTSPYAGVVEGALYIDGNDQLQPDSAFGADIIIQVMTISDQWLFLAGEYGAGTPSVGEAAWGLITGDIDAQLDLKASLDDKVSESDLNRQTMIGELEFPDAILSALDTEINQELVVGVFIYDTSQDDDGGLWVEQANYQSWYNEAPSETRGSKKQFPKVAIIVAEVGKVTIYDAVDGEMWMVFSGNNNNDMIRWLASGFASSITMKNGILCTGKNSGGGVDLTNFIDDSNWNKSATVSFPYMGTISERADIKGYAGGDTNYIVNSICNDVAVTSDGDMNNTVAVATDGGVSVIHPDGSVADSAEVSQNVGVAFDDSNKTLYYTRGGNLSSYTTSYSSDGFGETFISGNNTIPSTIIIATGNAAQRVEAYNGKWSRNRSEILEQMVVDISNIENSMIAYTTALYSTGFMQGDIKGAFLCNDKTSDRSTNANPLTEEGLGTPLTLDPVATGAELMAVSGFATDRYLEQAYNDDLNFGDDDFYAMVWVNTTDIDVGCIFARRDAAGTLGYMQAYVNISGAFIFAINAGGKYYEVVSTTLVNNNNWNLLTMCRRNGVISSYVNTIIQGSTSAPGTVDNIAAVLRVGLGHTGLEPLDGSMSLLRTGKGAPTADQIKEIYEAEKPLFQENAKCLLQNGSSDVKALSFNESSNILTVCDSIGTTQLNGLAVVSEPNTDVATSVSTNNGMEVYGS